MHKINDAQLYQAYITTLAYNSNRPSGTGVCVGLLIASLCCSLQVTCSSRPLPSGSQGRSRDVRFHATSTPMHWWWLPRTRRLVLSSLSLSPSTSLPSLSLSRSTNFTLLQCTHTHTRTQIKSRSQIFPLCGASVYEHVSRTGEVTYARDPGT